MTDTGVDAVDTSDDRTGVVTELLKNVDTPGVAASFVTSVAGVNAELDGSENDVSIDALASPTGKTELTYVLAAARSELAVDG